MLNPMHALRLPCPTFRVPCPTRIRADQSGQHKRMLSLLAWVRAWYPSWVMVHDRPGISQYHALTHAAKLGIHLAWYFQHAVPALIRVGHGKVRHGSIHLLIVPQHCQC